MRKAFTVFGVLLVLGFVASCDTEDPAEVLSQTLTISVNAVNAMADTYDVWTMIEDSNNDNQADDGMSYLWCEGPTTQNLSPITVPWSFSVQIDRIRAGTAERTVISSQGAGGNSFSSFNVANYDTIAMIEGQTPTKQPVTVGTRTFKFFGGRRLPSVNKNVMFATSNPLAALQGDRFGTTCPTTPTSAARRCGLCTRFNPGPARIDGLVSSGQVSCAAEGPSQCSMPYTITIDKGDTLIFQSRIATSAPGGVGLEVIRQVPGGLSATVQVDGRAVTLQGASTGSALSFSYTSR